MVQIPLSPSNVMKVFSIFHKLISVLYDLYHNPTESVMETHNTLVSYGRVNIKAHFSVLWERINLIIHPE